MCIIIEESFVMHMYCSFLCDLLFVFVAHSAVLCSFKWPVLETNEAFLPKARSDWICLWKMCVFRTVFACVCVHIICVQNQLYCNVISCWLLSEQSLTLIISFHCVCFLVNKCIDNISSYLVSVYFKALYWRKDQHLKHPVVLILAKASQEYTENIFSMKKKKAFSVILCFS